MKNKILAISNDPVLRDLLSKNMSQDKWDFAFTQIQDEGLKEVLEDESPDLILQDIIMPDLDGIRVSLLLRQHTDVPIIMVSAWGASDGMLRGLDLAAFSYLTEPFCMDNLECRMTQILEGSQGINRLVGSGPAPR